VRNRTRSRGFLRFCLESGIEAEPRLLLARRKQAALIPKPKKTKRAATEDELRMLVDPRLSPDISAALASLDRVPGLRGRLDGGRPYRLGRRWRW
jgi:hypothetical protein